MFEATWIAIKQNPEAIIALGSLIVALCSFVFTMYQFHASRKHDRLSVRPKLITHFDKSTTPTLATLSVVLKNQGLGPALIKKYQILHDKILVVENNNQSKMDSFIGEKFPRNTKGSRELFGPESIINSGEERVILTITFDITLLDNYEETLGKCDLIIDYTSLYRDENLRFDSRELPHIFG